MSLLTIRRFPPEVVLVRGSVHTQSPVSGREAENSLRLTRREFSLLASNHPATPKSRGVKALRATQDGAPVLRHKVGDGAELSTHRLVPYTVVAITPARTRLAKVEAGKELENEMNAFEVLFTLVFLRLVLPVGVLLLIGEWIQSRHHPRFHWR